MALENHSGRASRPRKKFDIFRRLDTIPACDIQPATFRQLVRAMHICVTHKNYIQTETEKIMNTK